MSKTSNGIMNIARVCLVAFALLAQAGMSPQASAKEISPQTPLTIEMGRATLVELDQPATAIFIANPDIADVQVPSPTDKATRFIVMGKKAGTTTAFAMTDVGRGKSFAITVIYPGEEISSAIHKDVPTSYANVTSGSNGITVSGTAPSPKEALKMEASARQSLGDKDAMNFNVGVEGSTQVNLRVQVAQISRTANKNFGFNWGSVFNNGTIAIGVLTGRTPTSGFGNFLRDTSTNNLDSIGIGYKSKGGSVNISGLIDALQTEGLVTILAEPNLTAISGKTASFLAGGEFPIPIAQGNQQISIEFKRFGVSVDFTPTVLDANRLSIHVRPEVSELTSVGSVTIDGVQVPALDIRRAETTVELASGQSFAIAGLFQNNASNSIQQIPWLGDVPVLGALFRSTSYQRNESELVFIVTPYIVKPTSKTSEVHLPTEGVVYASDLEQILLGRITAIRDKPDVTQKQTPETPHLTGAAGFIME